MRKDEDETWASQQARSQKQAEGCMNALLHTWIGPPVFAILTAISIAAVYGGFQVLFESWPPGGLLHLEMDHGYMIFQICCAGPLALVFLVFFVATFYSTYTRVIQRIRERFRKLLGKFKSKEE